MIQLVGPIYLIMMAVVGGCACMRVLHVKTMAALWQRHRRSGGTRISAFDAVVIVDGLGRIIELNSSAESMFGVASVDAKDRNIPDLVFLSARHERDRHDLIPDVRIDLMQIAGRLVAATGIRNGGAEFPIQMIINPVRKIGGRQLFAAYIRDDTVRARAIEKRRKLMDELAALSTFSAIWELTTLVAHELNQPLAVISSGTQFFRDTLRSGTGDPTAMLDAAELVAEQSERAGDLIRRIRSFVSKVRTSRRSTSVSDLIGDMVDLIHLEAQRSNVEVRLDVGKRLPAVFADPIYIQQVILNLVRNAIDAMGEDGSRRGRITISAKAPVDDMVRVSVRDTGKGIPAEIRERMFDPFFTTKPTGLGMGLPVCRTIIEAHEGALWADLDGGSGTAFIFTLPVIKKTLTATAVKDPFRRVIRGIGNIVLWARHWAISVAPKGGKAAPCRRA